MRSGKLFSSKIGMSLVVITLTCSLFFPAALQAGDEGYYVEQMVKSGPMMGQPPSEELTKMYMTPTKMKIVSGERGEMIFDGASKMLTFIIHAKQEYYVVAEEDFQAMMQMGISMMESMMGDAEPKVVAPGEKKKIGEWNCEKVVMTLGDKMTMEMWVSKDAGINMDAYLEMAEMIGQAGMLEKFKDEMKKIDGYPIVTNTTMSIMGQSVETETVVQAIKHETFAASTFTAPEGYTKKEGSMMEAMQALQGGQ
jgi:hypothetical protein